MLTITHEPRHEPAPAAEAGPTPASLAAMRALHDRRQIAEPIVVAVADDRAALWAPHDWDHVDAVYAPVIAYRDSARLGAADGR